MQQESQMEHFFGRKTSWVTYLVVLMVILGMVGGAYWFFMNKKPGSGVLGVKSLTDSA
jgi:flagellar basal body-associated protein FliL